MARQFISRGYEKIYVLKGGWNEWEKAKLPMEPK
jgi:rhodanese-related sulfurtransferase